jgi:hypothetical protein
MTDDALYDDGKVRLDGSGLTLRRYYFPTGASKRIAYDEIRAVQVFPNTWRTGKGRGWGTSQIGYWYPLDMGRFRKPTVVAVDLGTKTTPAFTPEDPDRVIELLRARTGR